MEQQPDPGISLFQLNLDASNSYNLRSAASWAKVLGVVGLIFGAVFILLGVLTEKAANSRAFDYGNFDTRSSVGGSSLAIFAISGLLYMISSIFAINFGNHVARALKTTDQHSLNSGFAAARNFFAFWAILMILALLFTFVGVVGLISR